VLEWKHERSLHKCECENKVFVGSSTSTDPKDGKGGSAQRRVPSMLVNKSFIIGQKVGRMHNE
jgi:hypothetical protein